MFHVRDILAQEFPSQYTFSELWMAICLCQTRTPYMNYSIQFLLCCFEKRHVVSFRYWFLNIFLLKTLYFQDLTIIYIVGPICINISKNTSMISNNGYFQSHVWYQKECISFELFMCIHIYLCYIFVSIKDLFLLNKWFPMFMYIPNTFSICWAPEVRPLFFISNFKIY